MKKKFIYIISIPLLSIILGLFCFVFAAQNPCPQETGGYMTTGARSDLSCAFSMTEHGYWWTVGASVTWVGAIIANAEGSFEESDRTVTYTGIQYSCSGHFPICAVCNCYYGGGSPPPSQ